jgi:hypothetical protein
MSSGVAEAPTRGRLSAEQIDQYRREGYTKFLQPVLPQAKFDALKNHFEQKLENLPEDQRPESMDVPHFNDPKLFDWLLADEVLDLVEPILGPDIALFSSHFICKPKGDGRKVPWHEDSYYWRGMMDPMEVCTVWLAIDPSTKVNGCMKVIPHALHGYSDYDPVDPNKNVFSTEIKKHLVDEKRQVYLELQPTQASLHDGKLMHGSEPNTSSIRRCGYTMRYISTRTKWNHEQFGQWQVIFLARGKDHAGNVYGDPSKRYDEISRTREKSGRKGH